jgi:hypothetical protein
MNGCRIPVTRGLLAASMAILSWATGVALAEGKDALKPGDPAVDGSFLKPYDNVWRYSVEMPDGKVIVQGLWSDHLQTTPVDGRQAMTRVQGMTYVNGLTSSTINVFDPKSMTPISTTVRRPNGAFVERRFDGKHVTTRHLATAGAEERKSEVDLDAPAFDFDGGLYGLILAALPLQEGYSGTLHAMDEDEDRTREVAFSVKGRETVTAGFRGQVEAWVVEAPTDRYVMRFWLTKEAPYIIKLRMTFSDRKNVATWEIIS